MLNQNVLDQFKQEVANELGVKLGAGTTSRDNGRVGAEMTKRLVELGKQQLEAENQTVKPYMMNTNVQQHSQLH